MDVSEFFELAVEIEEIDEDLVVVGAIVNEAESRSGRDDASEFCELSVGLEWYSEMSMLLLYLLIWFELRWRSC